MQKLLQNQSDATSSREGAFSLKKILVDLTRTNAEANPVPLMTDVCLPETVIGNKRLLRQSIFKLNTLLRQAADPGSVGWVIEVEGESELEILLRFSAQFQPQFGLFAPANQIATHFEQELRNIAQRLFLFDGEFFHDDSNPNACQLGFVLSFRANR